MTDSLHRTEMCGECGGLVASELKRLTGVTALTLRTADGEVISSGNPKVYIGPAAEPCTTPSSDQETDRVRRD